MSLASIADELYGLAPQQFTAARNARATAAGDRQLAAAVRRLARPSASAWAVNALVRRRPDEIERMRRVGAELREAQRTPGRDALRELAGERRALVGALVRDAADIAADAGHRLSAAARDEVAQTLLAALSDADAADAVRSGLLVRPLAPAGFDPVDLEGAVAVPGAVAHSPSAAGRPSGGTRGTRDVVDARERAEARSALRDAERRAEEAAAHLDALTRHDERAHRRRDRLLAELDLLRREADRLRADVAEAERELGELAVERHRAERDAAAAALAAEHARARVEPPR